ncbi:tRNA pseudouridine(55) synthase TruB [Paenibacillus sp. J2TS4]|uniref:tRNA pseudouridine(55) synthase TruB n=1 Tax=Paenibacillus sp. J2TS4 TaxID=2807194 RepID=UPI001B165DDB|nr:tRNA pseudouridine(55) synthase TruB [Paenibacillus sp. J2TS4]GIP33116.1 tRNA pseudouridine synthase B [Paenibacillus sp. J2TS4]
MTLEGVLPVLKPVDYTSHDVVAKVRRMIGIKRIGHTGTLDPKVTGVLPLCIGRATRVVEYIQDLPKEYEATLILGKATDTEDMSGRLIEEMEAVQVTAEQVRTAVESFVGSIEQVPPMYSAVKVDGRRLYELARLGQEVERKKRRVTIYEIELLAMNLERRHPEIRFRVQCSKGTYIRTLCTDVGKALGYPAVMSELVRSATGAITLDRCLTLPEIERLQQEGKLAERLIPTDEAIPHLPALRVAETEAIKALQGRRVRAADSVPEEWDGRMCKVYSAKSPAPFLGIFRWDAERSLLVPEKVFN